MVDGRRRQASGRTAITGTGQRADGCAGTRIVGYVNGQAQRLYVADTNPEARRDYHGVDLWARGNIGKWDVTASYTLAFLNGNVDDFFTSYGANPRLYPLYYGPIGGSYRHYLKGLINYAFDWGLTLGTRVQYFSGQPLWKIVKQLVTVSRM